MTRGIIPIFIPHMGCKNDCVFCNQNKISGCASGLTVMGAKAIIDRYLSTMEKDWIEIAFYGGSFTGLEMSLQKAFLEMAYGYKNSKKIQAIRLSTRPDYVSHDVLKQLKRYGVDVIELGCQSFDNAVLSAANRGHDAPTAVEACKRVMAFGFDLGIQLMVGLPLDSEEKWLFTVRQTIALNPSCVRIYPVLVIQNTALESQYLKGDYRPLDLETAILRTAEAYRLFSKKGISVIRMGLQKTDDLALGNSIVAGPYHESFGELVRSYLFKKALGRAMSGNDYENEMVIRVHPKQVSLLVGQKKMNLSVLAPFSYRIIQDEGIPLNAFDLVAQNENKRFHILEDE